MHEDHRLVHVSIQLQGIVEESGHALKNGVDWGAPKILVAPTVKASNVPHNGHWA